MTTAASGSHASGAGRGTRDAGAPPRHGNRGAASGGAPGAEPYDLDERMTPELEKRVMDIEMGRVKMTRYTPDEYMRHLEKILDG